MHAYRQTVFAEFNPVQANSTPCPTHMLNIWLNTLHTAASRALESSLTDALFEDPFAERLAGEAAMELRATAEEPGAYTEDCKKADIQKYALILFPALLAPSCTLQIVLRLPCFADVAPRRQPMHLVDPGRSRLHFVMVELLLGCAQCERYSHGCVAIWSTPLQALCTTCWAA